MRPASVVLLSLFAAGVAACAYGGTTKITLAPEATSVRVTTERPPRCAELGDVYGKFTSNDAEQAAKGARIDIRNRTAALGGDHVLLQTSGARGAGIRTEVVLSGIALRCIGGSGVPAPAAPPPQDVRSL
jgi:hypothetical protein